MKKIKTLIVTTLLSVSNAYAGPDFVSGTVSDISSVKEGLLIRVSDINGNQVIADNCTGTTYGWILIEKVDTTMISVVLTMWATGSKQATVYTDQITSGYCKITQVNPVN